MPDFVTVSMDKTQLKAAMRADCVSALSFYLEDELSLEVPELHEEIWDELVKITEKISNPDSWIDNVQKLFCVPRGHSKSTLIKIAVMLFFRYSPIVFVLYTSRTSALAKAACKDIVSWLTSDKDQELFGITRTIKSNDQEQLWILDIGMPIEGQRKTVILKALGSDQSVRGTLINNRRPELVIMDDIENTETSKDAESQTKLDVWLMGNLLKATARKSVRIIIGNMINSRTMLFRFSQDPKWNPTVYGAIVRNKQTGKLQSLWPGLWSMEALLEDYKTYRASGVGHVWLYEMMNMTQDTVFKTGMHLAVRIPRPLPDQVESGIIILDPAYGENNWNDYSGITVHVKIKDSGIPHIVESRKGRYSHEMLLDQMIELSNYWNLSTWGIESNSAQTLLIPLFKTIIETRRMHRELFTMIPLSSGGANKGSRILAFVTAVSSANYGICLEENDLVDELSKYDPSITKHDDLPDSAAYGIIAWSQAGERIKQGGFLKQKMALLQNDSFGGMVARGQSETVGF